MCKILTALGNVIKSTSNQLSTKEKEEKLTELLKEFKLNKGVSVTGIDGEKINLQCEVGSGYAISLVNETRLGVARGYYKAGTITTKHSHANPTIETISIIYGFCIVYFLDKEGTEVVNRKEVRIGETITIYPRTVHIVKFVPDTEILVVTIPKDRYDGSNR